MASWHRDTHVGRKNARRLQLSCRSVVAHARVEVAQAADGAYGGDATVQLQACVFGDKAVGDGSRETICHDLLYQRFVIALLLLGFAVACQVHMHVNEAWKQKSVFEVKGLAAR